MKKEKRAVRVYAVKEMLVPKHIETAFQNGNPDGAVVLEVVTTNTGWHYRVVIGHANFVAAKSKNRAGHINALIYSEMTDEEKNRLYDAAYTTECRLP